MSQQLRAMIQAIALSTILAIACTIARADSPHTFGHAAEEAENNTTSTRLDLYGKSIESLDGVKDYTSAVRIWLNDNQITNIPSDTFSELSDLQTLRLDGNQLTSIPSDAFSGLSSLQGLQLGRNRFTSIASDAYSGLSGLQTLSLDNNLIASIPSDAFSELSRLQTLRLDRNQLTSIPGDAFSGLSGLRYLYLSNNQLTRIPSDAFSGLSGLQNLGLWGNRLTSIPSNIFPELSSLRALLLSNNQITSIARDAFSELSGLQTLTLGDNQLTSIPSDAFSGLSDLQTLEFRVNQISNISSNAFAGLSGLQTLDLRHNQITQLNLSGATFLNLGAFLTLPGFSSSYSRGFNVHLGNTISSVDLSQATLSQTAFDVIVQDLDNGDVLSLDLNNADLSLVTSYQAIADWDDLQTIDLSFATLGSNEIDFLTDNLAGLNDLTVSRDQWNDFSAAVQDNLNAWDGIEGNTLTVPEPSSFVLVMLGLAALLSVRPIQARSASKWISATGY